MPPAQKNPRSQGPDEPKHHGIDTVEHLMEHLRQFLCDSAAIVCIGNELAGDDAAGMLIGQQIADRVPWQVFNVQTVPESFLMKIVAAKPEAVLLVDALDFAAAPGAVELVGTDEITGQGPSTHGPAPLAFLELLGMMHSCRCGVLGIQPAAVEFGDELSQPVRDAVDMVVQAFQRLAGEARQA